MCSGGWACLVLFAIPQSYLVFCSKLWMLVLACNYNSRRMPYTVCFQETVMVPRLRASRECQRPRQFDVKPKALSMARREL